MRLSHACLCVSTLVERIKYKNKYETILCKEMMKSCMRRDIFAFLVVLKFLRYHKNLQMYETVNASLCVSTLVERVKY